MPLSTSHRARLLLLAGFVSLKSLHAQAQQPQQIVNYNDHNLNGIATLEMLSMGAAFSNTLYGTSFIGFNLKKMGPWVSQWRTGSMGTHNGASALVGGIDGSLQFLTIPSANPGVGGQTFEDAVMRGKVSMRLTSLGQLQIGGALPDQSLHGDYKLSVAGKIVGQSLYITRPSSWADFVFAPGYKLRPLPELADYIACNEHLPDVPAATEVLRDGYDLNQMNARLLQKVEELTLYVIELNKKVATLEAAATRK